jgi:Dockerin type I domain
MAPMPDPCNPLQLTSVVSRKTHGSAGDFDVNLPLSGDAGVECRSTGANHTFVFSFTNNVVSGNASVTSGIGTVSGNPVFSGNTMTVNLTGVSDQQQITVTASNVMDTFGQTLPDTPVSAVILAGDTNGNRTVNAADVAQTKAQQGAPVDQTNFRTDVNANGTINAADTSLVKASLGNSVP